MTDSAEGTFLPSYDESAGQLPPPPPPYSSRRPSLSDIPPAYIDTSLNQTIALRDLTRNERTSVESKRKPCLVLFAYILAVFSCLFCGCLCGFMALAAIYLSEKNSRASNFTSNDNKCNTSFIYLVLSLVLSVAGILMMTIFLMVLFISAGNSQPSCRFDEMSYNGSCCAPIEEYCNERLIRQGDDGCKYCCNSSICLNHLKEIRGCPKCRKYSDKNSWTGCPYCCKEAADLSCKSSEMYRDSSGCQDCCPIFLEEVCLKNGFTHDESTNCKMCCTKCLVNSTKLDKNGCPNCCEESKSCDENGSYVDQNGCSQCCMPHMKNCLFYSFSYKIEVCRSCCNNPPLYKCSPHSTNSTAT